MKNFIKKLDAGHLIINSSEFQKVADAIGFFTKEQIMNSDLPTNLLFEIASGDWTDTDQREQIMDHLARRYTGMDWPNWSTPKEIIKEFKKLIEGYKNK